MKTDAKITTMILDMKKQSVMALLRDAGCTIEPHNSIAHLRHDLMLAYRHGYIDGEEIAMTWYDDE